ncbi:MAG TPA: sulfatase-like hydrolase/transferase, partial [Acidimicrobiia bacterium]|nr:sulfatase-like hydrolase/transferase [Acidimicrobiia bacterium]
FLDQTGDLDNTVVVAVSDNGASAEGGPKGSINDGRLMNGAPAGRRELRARIDEIGGPTAHNNYPWGWTMAGNTPFKRWKREVHEGGVADPCIVSVPGMTGRGGVRRQFAHAIDVMPTVLDLVGIELPAELDGISQSRVDGASFASILEHDDAPGTRSTQHFEMLGSRGIYHAGWKAVTFHPLGAMYDDGLDPDAPFDDDVWELYDVTADPSETNDLARAEPDRLAAMVELWWDEAARNDVLPLDNRPLFAILNPRPTSRQERNTYTYFPNGSPVPESVAVNVRNRSHTITAEISVGDGVVPEGTLLALGSVLGGFTLHLVGGRPRYVHNLYGTTRDVVVGDALVGTGDHTVAFVYTKTAEFTGRGELLVDGRAVGAVDIPHFTPMTFSYTGGGLTCGYEVGPAIGDGYAAPFRANVDIRRVVVDVSGTPHRDAASEYEAIMSEQ